MSQKNDNRNVLQYAGLATQWMVLMLVCLWGGFKLDAYLQLSVPAFTILLPLIALVVSLVKIIKEFSQKK